MIARALVLASCIVLAGCSTRSLPRYQKPIARTKIQTVRTTAYTHTESDHVAYSNRNALGGRLSASGIRSAAADWSRWPVGTVFRICETGEVYRVDDYGWALAGTNTIDLYKPSRSAMNSWGVRKVTIENLRWGSVDVSRSILQRRTKYRHVRRMLDQIDDRYAELKRPPAGLDTAYAYESIEQPESFVPIATMVPVASGLPESSSQPAVTPTGVPLVPFTSSFSR